MEKNKIEIKNIHTEKTIFEYTSENNTIAKTIECAIVSGAYLEGANLRGANLDEKEKMRLGIIIEKNTIVYKKCRNDDIVELELQKGSVVFSINNKKCRTINEVKIISINGKKTKGLKTYSIQDSSFEYEVGKKVKPLNPNLIYNVECGGGIHFFWTKKEAIDYE